MRTLSQVLAAFGSPRLVVLGDLLLDRYLTGVVQRISPEAPVQVLRVEEETLRLGGAGSVGVMVRALGAETTLIGVLGRDVAAEDVSRLAAEVGVTLDVVREAGRRTSVKTRHVARSHTSAQQVLRVDVETVRPLDGGIEQDLLARTLAALETADAVLVSDYGKGVCTPSLLARVIPQARRRGLPVVVDPKGTDFARYRGATCVTPNRPETAGATGITVMDGDDAAAERAATALIHDLGLDFALITLDREGMYLKIGAQEGSRLPTTPREVFDVTGAGDMVLSTVAVAIASGASPEEASALANVAAGLEVEHVGVVPITPDEIAVRLATGVEAADAKHVRPIELRALLGRARAEGKRIVFTNGCFDVLHAGHVRYLQTARAAGDLLVVGLNSDASVRTLKGEGRPVNPVGDRITVLSGLSAVDHVVVFEEDTPLELIRALEPDVLVKGEDWRDKGVVGRELVEARGGKVLLVPLLEGRSTTGILGRVRGEG